MGKEKIIKISFKDEPHKCRGEKPFYKIGCDPYEESLEETKRKRILRGNNNIHKMLINKDFIYFNEEWNNENNNINE